MGIAKGFRADGRYREVVGAARAYLAGLGTTGSLLAGAALMFIVASALVAFRGWPHVAAQPTPAEVVVSPHRAASGATLATRRLAFAAAAPAAGAGAARAAGGAAQGPARLTAGRGLGAGPGQPPRRSIGAPPSTSAPVSTAAGQPSSGSNGSAS